MLSVFCAVRLQEAVEEGWPEREGPAGDVWVGNVVKHFISAQETERKNRVRVGSDREGHQV
jgi:hypothetical protein